MSAEFYHGSPSMDDHTPAAAISAGDCVLIGTRIHVAHSDIAANDLGHVSSGTEGVYKVDLAVGAIFAEGAVVNVDPATGLAAPGAPNLFGYCVKAGADQTAGDTFVYARLDN